MKRSELSQLLLNTMRSTVSNGLNRGATGNLSVRCGEGFLITPSGVPALDMSVNDMVFMDMHGRWSGNKNPSSEWRFHRDILMDRTEFGAVLHTHSTFATVLSCIGKEIPAFHYMIGTAGGRTIPCASYATVGTQKLADCAVKALRGHRVCLLANHGMLVAAQSLSQTLALAVEIESLCEQYCHLLQIGTPVILPDTEMDIVLEKFKSYGKDT